MSMTETCPRDRPESNAAPPTVICIAGMHRSGTSMVARLLNLCGVYLGPEEDLGGMAPDNPDGFWENMHFVRLNDEILSFFGGGWDLPPADLVPTARPPADPPAAESEGWELRPELVPFRETAARLIQEMSAHPVWGWKDPRNSLTLPFWQRLLPGVKIVICLRNPMNVARSLHRRGYSSGAFGLRLWLAYNQRLLAAVPPEARVITHYDAYFHDGPAELRRVLDLLGLPVSEEVFAQALSAVSAGLRHNRAAAQDLAGPEVPPAVRDCYGEMCAQAGPVYQRFREAAPAVAPRAGSPTPGGTPADESQTRFALSTRMLNLQARLGEREEEIRVLAARLAAREEELRKLVVERDSTVGALTAQVADKEVARHQLAVELANTAAALDRMRHSKLGRLLRLYWRAKAAVLRRKDPADWGA